MKGVELGTIRVATTDLQPYVKEKSGWKKIKHTFPELRLIIDLFKAQGKFRVLVDSTNPRFLKGQLSKLGAVQGARINILPNGEKLEKAFSLFSPHIRIHDQDSDDHWDVLYQNKGGTWSYVYTLTKRAAHRASKYKKVYEFEKRYATLTKNVRKGLLDYNDVMAVPMHTLVNTYMRIGNEIYYKAHGHKGLTTLMKKDCHLTGNVVTFKYVGKDGVPITISQKFSSQYIVRLSSLLKSRKREEFIFSKNGHPMHEIEFKKAFARYCGHEFYPHIVRSHHATMKVKQFLMQKKKVSKLELDTLFMSIAHALGHKKYDKKNDVWVDHHAVTVNSYIQPELVTQVRNRLN